MTVFHSAGGNQPPVAEVIDRFPHPIKEVENDWIPLACGTNLAARYWLPTDADEKPVPAILEYIPYCKRDGTSARDEAMHPYFAGHGYAAVRVDIRGSGESDGLLLDEYLQQELDDACQVIDWISKQPWCNGRVGMMGKSWGGFNGLQVAALQPPALECIITVYSTVDRYADDIHYMGGCLLTENPNWSFAMFPLNARPPDPAIVGERWRQMWQDRLEANRPWIIDWLSHQTRDSYWEHGSVCEDFSAIKCPVFAIGGWADPYTNAVPALMEGLSVPCRGLVGPWGHQYPHQASPAPMAGFLQESLRWWDHWLKDRDDGLMEEPKYRVWMQEPVAPKAHHPVRPGHWVAEESWPSTDVSSHELFLNNGGLSHNAGDETELTLASPQTTGRCTLFWGNNGGGDPECPTDQRSDDAHSLCFDSPPLEEDLEILGAPSVTLGLTADQTSAFVAVRICEILPDGASSQVSFGFLNLTHREGHDRVVPLEPGELYWVKVPLNHIAHRFAAGNRIRVALSTALWPVVWPSPRPVTLSLLTGKSSLSLPRRSECPEDAQLRPLDPPHTAKLQARTPLRLPEPTVVRLEEDAASGRLTFFHVEDAGKTRIDSHGWCFGGSTKRRYSILPEDPTTAEILFENTEEYGRDGGPQIRIVTSQLMTCDGEKFHLQARLEAYEDCRPVFSRSWLEAIDRNGV